MEIRINTGGDYQPKRHKTEISNTLTVITALIVGIILISTIGYAIYAWKNKPDTESHPVKNKKIRQLLTDAEDVKPKTIQEKGGEP